MLRQCYAEKGFPQARSGRKKRNRLVVDKGRPISIFRDALRATALGRISIGLGYPGVEYVRTRAEKRNPAEVLVTALTQGYLEARVAEALPWLMLRYWQMDFAWLVEQAKKFDLQNRLGFVTSLARSLSAEAPDAERTRALSNLEAMLDFSRLAREDCFPRSPRSDTEREWLR